MVPYGIIWYRSRNRIRTRSRNRHRRKIEADLAIGGIKGCTRHGSRHRATIGERLRAPLLLLTHEGKQMNFDFDRFTRLF